MPEPTSAARHTPECKDGSVCGEVAHCPEHDARTQLGEHTFTGLAGEKVTITAWSNGRPGLRLTPVVNVRIDFIDGYAEMEVPAVSCPAFADVFRLAWEARNAS